MDVLSPPKKALLSLCRVPPPRTAPLLRVVEVSVVLFDVILVRGPFLADMLMTDLLEAVRCGLRTAA